MSLSYDRKRITTTAKSVYKSRNGDKFNRISAFATIISEKMPNHSVLLTPEAMAFFTFIISRENVFFAKLSLLLGQVTEALYFDEKKNNQIYFFTATVIRRVMKHKNKGGIK